MRFKNSCIIVIVISTQMILLLYMGYKTNTALSKLWKIIISISNTVSVAQHIFRKCMKIQQKSLKAISLLLYLFLSRRARTADTFTSLMVFQLDVYYRHSLGFSFFLTVCNFRHDFQHLMIFFHGFPRCAYTRLGIRTATAAASSTSLNKEAPWKKNGISNLQLFPKIYCEVPWSATVSLDIII